MDIIQLLVGGIANGCIYGLIAMGFVLIYKTTEGVNFAHGDIVMLGAFATLTFVNEDRLGLPFWAGFPLSILALGAVCYAIEALLVRRLFGQPQFSLIILTISLGFVLRFLAGVIWGHEPQPLEWPLAGESFTLGGAVLGYEEAFVVVSTAVLTLAMYLFFARTRWGIAMKAASQNQLAAFYMGIPVKRVSSLTWAVAGMTAAVAGTLFAAKGTVDPSLGFIGIKAFAAAVIGGFGFLPGALVGGLIIGVCEPIAQVYAPTGVSQIVPYALMLLVLAFRPHGIFSQVQLKKV